MKTSHNLFLVGCSGCFALALLIGIAGSFLLWHVGKSLWEVANFDEAKQPWKECGLPHPSGVPETTFMQKNIHPFMAEYEYKVRFGSGPGSVERWLPLNCGGRTLMNAYWYPAEGTTDPSIRLQDHWGEYLLKLNEQKTYLILRYKDRVYAGEISDSSPDYSMGEITTDGGKPQISVSVGENNARDITDTPIGQGPGKYFGRIDGQTYPLRFVPVSESPEQKIEMMP